MTSTVPNPIRGLHTATVANNNNIGRYFQQLADAGIPVLAKCADGSASLIDAQTLIVQGHQADIIYRKVQWPWGESPDFNDEPEHQAAMYVSEWERSWPKELSAGTVWFEPTNETDAQPSTECPRCDLERADWLGRFYFFLGMFAVNTGRKLLAFSANGGSPTFRSWDTPGVRRYLDLMSQYPDQLGIALHEYSWEPDGDILQGYDQATDTYFKVGRVISHLRMWKHMGYDTTRWRIYITEWGWAYDKAPSVDKAINDIAIAGELYARYAPEVKGVFIWALDVGQQWADIGNTVNSYMTPLADHVINNWITVDRELTDPPPGPDMNDIETLIASEMERIQIERGIRWNPEAGLAKSILADNLFPVTSEEVISGIPAQVGESPDGSRRIVYYWKDGQTHRIVTRGADDDNDDGVISPPPPPRGDRIALLGLHYSADGGTGFLGGVDGNTAEISEFATLQPEIVKFLSSHSPVVINRIVQATQPYTAKWVVRAYLSFHEPTTPHMFVDRTYPDTNRTVAALMNNGVRVQDIFVELHNEQNLSIEGLGQSWGGASEFGQWVADVARMYRGALPAGMRLLYPAVSPGHAFDNGAIRRDNGWDWMVNNQTVIDAYFDGVGVHTYWQDSDFMAAKNWVNQVADHFPTKTIIVTEASKKGGWYDIDQIAQEYVNMTHGLASNVLGVTYFVSSASNTAEFGPECWLLPEGDQLKSRGIAAAIKSMR